MDKLFKMLERGEMPDFLEVLSALNDISDLDWQALEHSSLPLRQGIKTCRIPEHPQNRDSGRCELC
jgi:hypothetical protein